MPQLDARREYADGTILFAADLDAIIDDIETLLNSTKLNDDNIQDGGITGSTKLVDGSVSAGKLATNAVTTVKIEDDAVTAAKVADGAIDLAAKLGSSVVTTIKINDLAVTTAKLDDLSVTAGKIGALAVTTAKIDDLAVTAAKIAATTITGAKLATDVNLPVGAKLNSREFVVGSYAMALVPVAFAGFTGAGFSGSGSGWSVTGDGNLQTATFTFTTAYASTPAMVLSHTTPSTVALSGITTTGFTYTSSAGSQSMPAFTALFMGVK